MLTIKIYHSLVEPASLLAWLNLHYDVGLLHSCRLIRMGLNDTYEVHSLRQKFIVRLYRAAWRSLPDVQAELELLLWLKHRDFPIAAPLADKKRCFLNHFTAPEGVRAIVVFVYIEGQALALDKSQAHAYGQALAQFHTLTEDFRFHSGRFCLDARHLLDEPLAHIHRAFGHLSEMTHLTKVAQTARPVFQALANAQAAYGVCHGDHFGNVLQTADRQLVFIDFDCCGMGFRIYDLVQFWWAIRLRIPAWHETYLDTNDALWHAFLEGYASLRPLLDAEQQALPALFVVRTIWGLGLQPQNERHWGIEGIDAIWRQNVAML